MQLNSGSTIAVTETVDGRVVEYGGSVVPAAKVVVLKRGEVELVFNDGRKLRLWLATLTP